MWGLKDLTEEYNTNIEIVYMGIINKHQEFLNLYRV